MEFPNDDLSMKIQSFCNFTGASIESATCMLEACDYDLELAVSLQLEVEPSFDATAANVAADAAAVVPAGGTAAVPDQHDDMPGDGVRAPIPPREEMLVDSIHEHYLNSSHAVKRGLGGPFRDFQAEAAYQERVLRSQGSPPRGVKVQRLEDLFRPPLQMMFNGGFEAARDAGMRRNKWVMINPQKLTEFQCQVMNRDVWSHPTIQAIVQAHFVFLQVDVDSAEGRRYDQFYNVDKYPYVAVIDPRTGELVKKWNDIEAPFFAESLLNFLLDNASPCQEDDDLLVEHCDGKNEPKASKAGLPAAAGRPQTPDSDSSGTWLKDAIEQIGDVSTPATSLEDEVVENELTQGNDSDGTLFNLDSSDGDKSVNGSDSSVSDLSITSAKIPNESCPEVSSIPGTAITKANFSSSSGTDSAPTTDSGLSSTGTSSDSFSDEVDCLVESKTDKQLVAVSSIGSAPMLVGSTRIETPPPEGSGTDVALSLKFPNDRREVVNFSSMSKVASLQNYLVQSGFPMTTYDYVTFFPKRTLSTLQARNTTLASLGIVHNETIFIHQRDLEDMPPI